MIRGRENIFCTRHLYANFKLKFKDKAFKHVTWSTASACREDEWRFYMNELKRLSLEAHDWNPKVPKICGQSIFLLPIKN